QAAVVLATRARWPVDLGEDLQALPPLAGQRPAEHRLRLGVGVHVGRVERGDPGVERGPHTRSGLLLLHLGAVGDPVAVRDLTDRQPAAAKSTKLHTFNLATGSPG